MGLEYDLFISNLFSKADKEHIPLSGAFELTSRCPLDCKMCYIHKKENDCDAIRQEKSAGWWLKLAEQAKEAGMLLLLLTGGEPLLRKDFEEIYLGAKKLGLLVSVNTNALLIDDEKVKFFTDYPPHKLNVSLYGASEETYRDLCGNGKAYEKVFTAVKKLKKAGVDVKINFTATKQNKNDAEKIYEFTKELAVPVQTVTYMFPPVRVGGEADRLSPKEAAKLKFGCRLLDWGCEKLTQHLEAKAKLVHKNDESGVIPCRAGKSTFWVTFDGRLTPCGMMNEPACDIEDFASAWSYVNEARNKIILSSECRECEKRNYCDVCAAVAYAETGKFNGVPDYACQKAAEYKKLCERFMCKTPPSFS